MVVIIPLLSRLGRVKCYCGSFISGGVCCFIVALITIFAGENSMVMVTVGIAMLGKLDQNSKILDKRINSRSGS